MILAAFIDAGLPLSFLQKELRKLKIKNWDLKVKNVEKKNLPAKQVIVQGEKKFPSREEMIKIVKESGLKKKIKKQVLDILSALIDAEKKVHKINKNFTVHLHELANLDTLIDIVGGCIAIEKFGLDKIYASPINVGSLAPVAVELLKGLPIYATGSGEELTTPTGAAIISHIAKDFGPMPIMKIKKYGFGAGSKDLVNQPNLLRLTIGETIPSPCSTAGYEYEEVLLLETNIDDMNPQIYPYVMEKLIKNGALDVWLTPVQMKKGRPGIVLSCLVDSIKKEKIIDLLFRETTTLGIRLLPWERVKLRRKVKRNPSGLVYKVGEGKNFKKEKVEYDTAVKFVKRSAIPLKNIL